MMRKVEIVDPEIQFLERQVVDKLEFMDENDWIYGKKVFWMQVIPDTSSGYDSYRPKLRDENSILKGRTLKLLIRGCVPATSSQVLQGITRAALQTTASSPPHRSRKHKVLNEQQYSEKSTNWRV
jgi:DNA-directed RNA polymerase subunit beta'